MVALNLLRELDTLLRHAVAEARCARGDATLEEKHGFATVDAVRQRLAAVVYPASGRPRRPRPGVLPPVTEELHAALVMAVDLTAAVTGRLLADPARPAATLPAASAPDLAAVA